MLRTNFYFMLLSMCVGIREFVECGQIFPKDMSANNQLLDDVLTLKEGMESLQKTMENLSKKYTSHSELLHEISDKIPATDDVACICPNQTDVLNETLRNSHEFEEKVLATLEKQKHEHELYYNKVQLKLDKLTNQLYKFNVLEDHLIEQQRDIQNFIDNQEKTIQDLTGLIVKTHDKLNSIDEKTAVTPLDLSQQFEEFMMSKIADSPLVD